MSPNVLFDLGVIWTFRTPFSPGAARNCCESRGSFQTNVLLIIQRICASKAPRYTKNSPRLNAKVLSYPTFDRVPVDQLQRSFNGYPVGTLESTGSSAAITIFAGIWGMARRRMPTSGDINEPRRIIVQGQDNVSWMRGHRDFGVSEEIRVEDGGRVH
ncbi:hypothetical protein SISSUDRAFT_1121768 [Sistotremastrum suecicum HHB10207 ss-3]|uniref:Uncharacterized protein n=1 Tax=Sistotremastrum suecicum HHB10207 ss-3 TaxID=1314776 RepID=A0A166ABT0_9AGAM|nr:hypothetical protein SISSUDRAFT_1121768 [Sistotremastrum suecicum HHB10207 ss-3]